MYFFYDLTQNFLKVNFNCWNTSKEVTDPMIDQGLGLGHDGT